MQMQTIYIYKLKELIYIKVDQVNKQWLRKRHFPLLINNFLRLI